MSVLVGVFFGEIGSGIEINDLATTL